MTYKIIIQLRGRIFGGLGVEPQYSGILHQAQTKGKSVVRIDRRAMIQSVENDNSKSLIVDRALFHKALEQEILSYKEKLKLGGNENSEKLRSNFVKKMNFICDVAEESAK